MCQTCGGRWANMGCDEWEHTGRDLPQTGRDLPDNVVVLTQAAEERGLVLEDGDDARPVGHVHPLLRQLACEARGARARRRDG